MTTAQIIKEELNTQFVNKELSGLETLKKQLDAKLTANPMLAKELSGPIAEIDKKVTRLKYAVAEYSKNKAMESKTGVGTQSAATDNSIQPVVKDTVSPTEKVNPAVRKI